MKTTPLRFEDITKDHPCSSCHKPCGGRFRAVYETATGLVRRVVCNLCFQDEMFTAFSETCRITTALWMDAMFTHHDPYHEPRVDRDRWYDITEINNAMVRVGYAAKLFDKSVWLPHLQSIVRGSKVHGLSSKEKFSTPTGQAKFLAYAIAGRAMITLETETASVTLITDETSKESRMGVQGISATGDEACELIMAAIEAWQAGKIQMVEDVEVGMG